MFVSVDGVHTTVEAAPRATVMLAALTHGIAGITADCNGYALCATCHVFADDPRLPPRGDAEDAMLDGTAVPRQANSRLACQIPALDGLVVRLPERQS